MARTAWFENERSVYSVHLGWAYGLLLGSDRGFHGYSSLRLPGASPPLQRKLVNFLISRLYFDVRPVAQMSSRFSLRPLSPSFWLYLAWYVAKADL